MAIDPLKDVKSAYDVAVIGGGLGGLTIANCLAKQGHSVAVFEHHYKFGGLATWFKRKGGHTFDISLHGFPVGMIKSARRYWTQEIADSIRQLEGVRFVNPNFDITTTFDREDFTRILIEKFDVPAETVEGFFTHLRKMNYYDNDERTTRELFEEFFPGRKDIHRFLLEPIAYANGSTLDDPAITYGIVFSNFMSKGVFIFQGGTDVLIQKMTAELKKNGVDLFTKAMVNKIEVDTSGDLPEVKGLVVNDRFIEAKAVVSNANIKNTIFRLLGKENIDPEFAAEAEAVRLNNSSCQVYMGIKEGETIPNIGELVFTSENEAFSSDELTDFHTRSRTFSMYYPDTRPHTKTPRYTVVASLNAKYNDWAELSEEEYQKEKDRICEESVAHLEKYIPGVREKIDWVEAATPRTVEGYTQHFGGTSFGTKFEGLKISMGLPEQVRGLYHSGSVGIIMSGWLGTINYGVINSNKVDQYLFALKQAEAPAGA